MIRIDELFTVVLRASAEASVLLILVLVVQRVFRHKLPAQWRYGLWLVVVIRLLLPALPESGLSVFNWIRVAETQHATTEFVVEAKAGLRGSGADNFSDVVAPVLPTSHTMNIVATVWLIGAVSFLCAIVVYHLRIQRFVAAQRPVTDSAVLNLLEDCKAEMKLTTPVLIVMSPDVKSPALFGLIRPRILLPASAVEMLSREELRFILLHELGHIKQFDICLNWVAAALQALHWFNPFLWFAFARMRTDRELACDSVVLSQIGEGQSPAYGQILLKMVETYSKPTLLPSTAGILEDKSEMRHRIVSIARYKRSLGLSAAGFVTLLLLAMLGLTSPSASSRSSGSEQYRVVKQLVPGSNPAGDLSNQEFHFDGEKTFLRLGNHLGNFQTNDFTIDFWMSSKSPLHWNIMGKRSVCNAADFWEIRGGGTADEKGNVGLEIRVKGEQNARVDLQSNKRINDGEYHHVAFVREGKIFHCYVDGALESSVESERLLDIHNAANLYFGIGPCAGVDETRFYEGSLKRVIFHNRALSRGEVASIAANSRN